jgi:hypothetical protein
VTRVRVNIKHPARARQSEFFGMLYLCDRDSHANTERQTLFTEAIINSARLSLKRYSALICFLTNSHFCHGLICTMPDDNPSKRMWCLRSSPAWERFTCLRPFNGQAYRSWQARFSPFLRVDAYLWSPEGKKVGQGAP